MSIDGSLTVGFVSSKQGVKTGWWHKFGDASASSDNREGWWCATSFVLKYHAIDDVTAIKDLKDSKDLKDPKDLKDLKDLNDTKDSPDAAPERMLPLFTQGESGPHTPELQEKWTQPPKPYTEATLLRAMETAGKTVEDEELRDALKENGIGRPSTRAAIIETLFKRNYIVRERKTLQPTQTGVELIHIIHEEVLKSAELTGIWEKHLRDIEKGTYEPHQFLDELKQMLGTIVTQVLNDTTNRRIT